MVVIKSVFCFAKIHVGTVLKIWIGIVQPEIKLEISNLIIN